MCKKVIFTTGMNLNKLIPMFRSIGGDVAAVRRTGEQRFSHPGVPQTPKCNGRRKDAPRHIVEFAIAATAAQGIPSDKHKKGR